MKKNDRAVENWSYAADDAYTALRERQREYPIKTMLAIIDDLARRGASTQEDMVARHGPSDLIATTLGHVTTALHGRGSVPKTDGWYRVTDGPRTYHIEPAFALAWKSKRRLR